jgi:hypothetical protein
LPTTDPVNHGKTLMNSLALDLSRNQATAVVTAAALAGCAGGACRARCSTAASACSGKKCGACGAKK